jgi:hypothetical protein
LTYPRNASEFDVEAFEVVLGVYNVVDEFRAEDGVRGCQVLAEIVKGVADEPSAACEPYTIREY